MKATVDIFKAFRGRRDKMPYGGALLTCSGGKVSDGLATLWEFSTHSEAVATLQVAGFKRLSCKQWK